MVIKGRSPAMRHVGRTHRVDLDWLWQRLQEDPGINMKFVGTKQQIADILTKANFTTEQWNSLLRLAQPGELKPAKQTSNVLAIRKASLVSCPEGVNVTNDAVYFYIGDDEHPAFSQNWD